MNILPLPAEYGEGADSSLPLPLPRTDLLSALDKDIISKVAQMEGKGAWQVRKGALELILTACKKCGYSIEGNKPLSDLVRAVRARLSDTQANLKPIAAATLGAILVSLEGENAASPSIKVLRTVAPGLLGGIGDNKKQMRDASLTALQAIVTQTPDPPLQSVGLPVQMAVLVSPMAEALMNTVGRLELINWILTNVSALPSFSSYSSNQQKGGGTDTNTDTNGNTNANTNANNNANEIVAPLVAALQDKVAGVRTAAEQLLVALAIGGNATAASFDKATRDLSPAIRRGIHCLDRLTAAFASAGAEAGDDATNATSNALSEKSEKEKVHHGHTISSHSSHSAHSANSAHSQGTSQGGGSSQHQQGKFKEKDKEKENSPVKDKDKDKDKNSSSDRDRDRDNGSGPSSLSTSHVGLKGLKAERVEIGRSRARSKTSATATATANPVRSLSTDKGKSIGIGDIKREGGTGSGTRTDVDLIDEADPFVLKKTSKAARLEQFKSYSVTDDVSEADLLALQKEWEPLIMTSSTLCGELFPPEKGRNRGGPFNQDSFLRVCKSKILSQKRPKDISRLCIRQIRFRL